MMVQPRWTNLTVAGGPPRSDYASMIYDAADHYVLLFGGISAAGNDLNETWSFSGGYWRNITSIAGSAPSARYDMAMTYDASDNYVLAFGGSSSAGTVSDTWSFVAGKWHQEAISRSPVLSDWVGMTYDAADSYVLLFDAGVGYTYTYRAGVWTQLAGASNSSYPEPGQRQEFGLTYDAKDGYALLFGGWNGQTQGDTWKFSTGKWTNITGSLARSPSARAAPQMTYNDATGQVILFGGYSWPFSALSDTWSFTGGAWNEIVPALSPPGRYGGDIVNDASDSIAVLFGGDTQLGESGNLNDTWAWGVSPPMAGLTIVVTPFAPLPNQEASFNNSFNGGAGPFSYTWRFGDGSTSALPNPTHSYLTAGIYSVELWVNDSAGHSANSSIRIHVYTPLTISGLAASPNPAAFGQVVNFTASATGGTSPYTYAWAFGDGGTGGNLSSISHVYTTNGPFDAELTVADAAGGVAHSYVNVSIKLQALAGSTGSNGASPLVVSFVGQGQGGSPPYTFSWNFGDGTPVSALQNPKHTYNASGGYTVTLSVKDREGNQSTSSLTITVGSPSGGPAGSDWSGGFAVAAGAAGTLGAVWGAGYLHRRSKLAEANRWVEELTTDQGPPDAPPPG